MKKLICTLLMVLIPLLGFAQEAKKEGPKKETINSYRVFPKDGHDAALKAALGAHAQKYHTGSWKWRVSEILTGPDTGAYMIVEGPNSWTENEERGNLGAEHMKDYDTNVLPHVEKTTPTVYGTYVASGSTVTGGAFSPTKTLISHVYVKPGRGPAYAETLKTWKKIYEKRGVNVAVWNSFFSGEPAYTIAARLKNGWKDLDEDAPSFRKVADEIGGAGAYDKMLADDATNIDHVVREMIEYKPDMSSK